MNLIKENKSLLHLKKSLRYLKTSDKQTVESIIFRIEKRLGIMVTSSLSNREIRNITNWERSSAICSINKLVRNFYGHPLDIKGIARNNWDKPWPEKQKILISNTQEYINQKVLLTRVKRERLTKQGLSMECGFDGMEFAITSDIKQRLLKDVYEQNKEYFDNVFYKRKSWKRKHLTN